MADFISRDAAYQAIEAIDENAGARGSGFTDPERIMRDSAFYALDAIKPADVVPAPRWIPVTERFPPLDKEVLVFAIGLPEWGFEGKTATAIAYRFVYRFWSSGKWFEKWSTPWEHFHKDYKITHWMPLPEPPKEVEA